MEKEKNKETFQDFQNKALHREIKRDFKAFNSYTTYSIYKHIRKNKWYNIGRPLTEHEFYLIVRTVNKLLAKELLRGHVITLPHSMGSIELRKRNCGARLKKGKLKITYPINWRETLKLWYKDGEARRLKTLIRFEEDVVYKVVYNKSKAYYSNKRFMLFSLTRGLKKALNEGILSGETDTLFEDY